MQESLFYLIDKNVIKNNILEAKDKFPLNVDSVIDGRFEFYGLGNDIISVVEKCEINYVLVNSIKEALNLRKYNDSIYIIVKYFEKEYIFDAILNNIMITVYSYKELEELEELNIKDDYNVFLYINDTIEGFSNLNKISKYLENNKHLKIKGVYTEIQSKKALNKKIDEFNNVILDIPNVNRFIISDNIWDLNTSFYNKNSYIKNINEIVTLQGSIKHLKRIRKNEIFLDKKWSKDKVFAIVDLTYNLALKKVYIKNNLYKVNNYFNNNADSLTQRYSTATSRIQQDLLYYIDWNLKHQDLFKEIAELESLLSCDKEIEVVRTRR